MVASRHQGRSDLNLGFIGICSMDDVFAGGGFNIEGLFWLYAAFHQSNSDINATFFSSFPVIQYFCCVEQRCSERPWP